MANGEIIAPILISFVLSVALGPLLIPFLKRIKAGEVHYDFVEVMACYRGCVMGGGQPVPAGPRTKSARMKGLYDSDVNTQIKKSNENPLVQTLYDGLLKGKEHKLLHRNFEAAKNE